MKQKNDDEKCAIKFASLAKRPKWKKKIASVNYIVLRRKWVKLRERERKRHTKPPYLP